MDAGSVLRPQMWCRAAKEAPEKDRGPTDDENP